MGFGGGLNGSDDVMSEINMTPLVDVMLVLLVIFMITVPVLTHSIPVNLPEASNIPSDTLPDTIRLTVTAEGEAHWNDLAVSHGELDLRLQAAARQQPQPAIHIRGDREVQYHYVAKVMATVQRAGLTRLGFVTAPGSVAGEQAP